MLNDNHHIAHLDHFRFNHAVEIAPHHSPGTGLEMDGHQDTFLEVIIISIKKNSFYNST
jgi:hypothetical protein